VIQSECGNSLVYYETTIATGCVFIVWVLFCGWINGPGRSDLKRTQRCLDHRGGRVDVDRNRLFFRCDPVCGGWEAGSEGLWMTEKSGTKGFCTEANEENQESNPLAIIRLSF